MDTRNSTPTSDDSVNFYSFSAFSDHQEEAAVGSIRTVEKEEEDMVCDGAFYVFEDAGLQDVEDLSYFADDDEDDDDDGAG